MSAPEPGPRERTRRTGLCGHSCAKSGTAESASVMPATMRNSFVIRVYPPARYTRRDIAMSAIQKIGILGLGKMGAPMARHLSAKGFNVAGYDPVDAARRNAASLGVSVLDAPSEVARASDALIVVVGFDHE